jgi:hypothetical protein
MQLPRRSSIEERLGNCIAEAIDDFGPDFDAEGNPIEEGESDRVVSREEREREEEGASEEASASEEDDNQSADGDGDGNGPAAKEDEEPGKEKDTEAATA